MERASLLGKVLLLGRENFLTDGGGPGALARAKALE
jgi:hypothetical protein